MGCISEGLHFVWIGTDAILGNYHAPKGDLLLFEDAFVRVESKPCISDRLKHFIDNSLMSLHCGSSYNYVVVDDVYPSYTIEDGPKSFVQLT